MFSSNIQILGRERDREKYQEAERIRLVKIARGEQSGYWGGLRTFANWLGQCMIKWGEKLRDAGSIPLPEVTSTVTDMG